MALVAPWMNVSGGSVTSCSSFCRRLKSLSRILRFSWKIENTSRMFLSLMPYYGAMPGFAKLPQKKNAATSKKITTLSKSCSVLSRTFLFALFFDFGNLLCRCGYNPYACIAHTVKKRVKLPPLRVLLRRRF